MSKLTAKAIVEVGYTKYVMEASDAVTIANILANAELYAEKWRTSAEGGTSYYIWEQDKHIETPIRVLPTNLYNMYKLAGKPEEN